jgi:heme/copper-type cytochrome/quinol oxidase subunit 1
MIGLTVWWPVVVGTANNAFLREAQFTLLFLGVNLTFFPMHFLGIQGMPRRYREYQSVFTMWHSLASVGRVISLASVFFLFFIWWESLTRLRLVLTLN